MAERTYDEREPRDPLKERNRMMHDEEDDSRRAFPLAAAAFGATLFLFIMLIVNWVC
jgi:hypothetical protein